MGCPVHDGDQNYDLFASFSLSFTFLRSGFSAGEEQEKRKLMFSEHLLNAAGFFLKGSCQIVTSCTVPVPPSYI